MLTAILYMYMGLMSASTQTPPQQIALTSILLLTVNSATFVQTCRFFLLGISVHFSHLCFSVVDLLPYFWVTYFVQTALPVTYREQLFLLCFTFFFFFTFWFRLASCSRVPPCCNLVALEVLDLDLSLISAPVRLLCPIPHPSSLGPLIIESFHCRISDDSHHHFQIVTIGIQRQVRCLHRRFNQNSSIGIHSSSKHVHHVREKTRLFQACWGNRSLKHLRVLHVDVSHVSVMFSNFTLLLLVALLYQTSLPSLLEVSSLQVLEEYGYLRKTKGLPFMPPEPLTYIEYISVQASLQLETHLKHW